MIRRSTRAGLVAAVVVAACALALGGSAFSRPGDKKPPRVSITAPSAGATLPAP